MKKQVINLLKFLLVPGMLVCCISFTLQQHRPVLYIIGDSTVKNGDGKNENLLQGWGSFLDDHLILPGSVLKTMRSVAEAAARLSPTVDGTGYCQSLKKAITY